MFKFQERILLHQIQNGNHNAFSKLYDYYVEQIQRFIYFKISNKEISQDLTNEVFIKVLKYLANGGKIDNFRAFLYRTARNLIIDFYRDKSTTVSLEEIVEISDESNFNENVDQKLALENIKKYLNVLKPEYQEVILLRFFEDLPFPEIAKILDESEANVRQRAHRGIKILKEHLKETK